MPTFDVVPSDVEGFMDELRAFQAAFHGCFARSEPRAHFFDFWWANAVTSNGSPSNRWPRRSRGGTSRGLQRFISDAVWDEEQMLWNYQHLVADEMGAPDGVLMLDETGFVKKGRDSVGGARQYCGTLGKVENCQVGVFAAYASRRGYALVAKRLLLPEVWFTDAYKPVVGEYRRRRRRDGLREDVARRDGAVPRISAPAPGDAVAARECLSPRPVHTLGSAAAP